MFLHDFLSTCSFYCQLCKHQSPVYHLHCYFLLFCVCVLPSFFLPSPPFYSVFCMKSIGPWLTKTVMYSKICCHCSLPLYCWGAQNFIILSIANIYTEEITVDDSDHDSQHSNSVCFGAIHPHCTAKWPTVNTHAHTRQRNSNNLTNNIHLC